MTDIKDTSEVIAEWARTATPPEPIFLRRCEHEVELRVLDFGPACPNCPEGGLAAGDDLDRVAAVEVVESWPRCVICGSRLPTTYMVVDLDAAKVLEQALDVALFELMREVAIRRQHLAADARAWLRARLADEAHWLKEIGATGDDDDIAEAVDRLTPAPCRVSLRGIELGPAADELVAWAPDPERPWDPTATIEARLPVRLPPRIQPAADTMLNRAGYGPTGWLIADLDDDDLAVEAHERLGVLVDPERLGDVRAALAEAAERLGYRVVSDARWIEAATRDTLRGRRGVPWLDMGPEGDLHSGPRWATVWHTAHQPISEILAQRADKPIG